MQQLRSGERGQVVPVVALFLVVLTGFLGIVIDGGIGYTHKRHDQDVVDAASLAGAYSLYTGGTLAQAQSAANQVATLDGCTGVCSLQPLSWYDAAGALLSGSPLPASVGRVGASVSDSETTTFARITPAGSRTVGIGAWAQALVRSAGSGTGSSTTLSCELCLLGNLSINAQNNSVSSSAGDLDVNGSFSISAGSTTWSATNGHSINASGSSYTVNGPNTMTPTPKRSPPPPPITDPLAGLPTPVITGLVNRGNYSFPTQQSTDTISPGIYGTISIGGQNSTLTLNPGVYEITGGLTTNASTVVINGAGVILYFVCSGSCAPGQVGAGMSFSSQTVTLNLSAPTTGIDNGILFFADRNNSSTFQVNTNSFGGSLTGAFYAASGNITLGNQNFTSFASPIVANNLTIGASGLTLGLSGSTVVNISPASPGGLSQ